MMDINKETSLTLTFVSFALFHLHALIRWIFEEKKNSPTSFGHMDPRFLYQILW